MKALRGLYAITPESLARAQLQRWQWTETDYQRCVELLREQLPVYEAEAGFFPPKARS